MLRILVLLMAGLVPLAGFAASDRVVGVVNDQVITMSQLEARTKLAMRHAGMTNPSPEQKKAGQRRMLANLIDEELQRQFAVKNGLEVMKAEVAKTREDSKAAMGPGKWEALTGGLDGAVDEEVAAGLRWQRIVAREVRPRVNVTTAEADKLIQELSQKRHVLEREISMILLNQAEGEEDQAKLKELQDIRTRITEGKSSFEEEAKAYSDDKSAVNGGKLGWFSSGELNAQLEEALDKMQPGTVSEPIRTPLGWHLVKLENVRTTQPIDSTALQTQLEVYLLGAPLPADEEGRKKLEDLLETATRELKKPEQVRAYFEARQYGETFGESAALGWISPDDMKPDLRDAVAKAKVGEWTPVVEVGGNMARIYAAGSQKVVPEKLTAYRERVMESLTANRVELAARRFMRELRQKAFVDVRL